MAPALRIQGNDATLAATVGATFGTTANAALIGLRVDYNVLSSAFLTFSDRRLKTDIVVSDGNADVATLMNIPVCRFAFKDGPPTPTIGFIAQEVEAVAPYAVRTTAGAIPSHMCEATVDDNGDTQVDTQVLTMATDHGLEKGERIKVICNNNDMVLEIIDVVDARRCVVKANALSPCVFVYGRHVNDLKLIDSDRLLPVVFNAVKKMVGDMASVMARLAALEAKMN